MGVRSHITQLTLSRLGRIQVEAMIEKLSTEQVLPHEDNPADRGEGRWGAVVVEELTKMVYRVRRGSTDVRPTTGYSCDVARCPHGPAGSAGGSKRDRATRCDAGGEFSYELLHAVSSLDESYLQQALRKLVESELLYQRGLLPQAHYVFKHALIQDTAYQSLLKSTARSITNR